MNHSYIWAEPGLGWKKRTEQTNLNCDFRTNPSLPLWAKYFPLKLLLQNVSERDGALHDVEFHIRFLTWSDSALAAFGRAGCVKVLLARNNPWCSLARGKFAESSTRIVVHAPLWHISVLVQESKWQDWGLWTCLSDLWMQNLIFYNLGVFCRTFCWDLSVARFLCFSASKASRSGRMPCSTRKPLFDYT